jgi:hypothetical protein
LTDANAFDLQLKQQIANDNAALLKLQLGNKSALDASDREFQKMVAQIDIDTAIRMQRENADFAARQGGIQAFGQAVTTGINVAGKMQEGAADSGYQNYVDNQKAAGKSPVSYTAYKSRLEAGPPKPGTI